MDIINFSTLIIGKKIIESEDPNYIDASAILSYTIGKMIYDNFDAMIPERFSFQQYQEYIFSSAVQLIYNQVFFSDNYKKLLIEQVFIILAIYGKNNFNNF